MKRHVFVAQIALMAWCSQVIAQTPLPAKAPNFRLMDATNRSHELYRLEESPAVVLLSFGAGCPMVQQLAPEWKELLTAFAPRGVVFLAIDPNADDTREAVATKSQAAGLELPILMDDTQMVSKSLGYTRIAEALVLNPKQDWSVVYRGASTKAALGDALGAMLESQPLAAAPPASTGCSIDYAAVPTTISYARDVAPILQAKCATCHHTDGIAPFAMSNLQKVQGWSDMIGETLLTQRMPPWHADPHFGTYKNDLGLTATERATLLAWAQSGAPGEADGADPLAAASASTAPEWALGTPDQVVEMPSPESLPADGVVDYRYRYIPSGFTEDKWVRGLEVKAGNPKVVHHALIFIIYPKQYRHLQPQSRGGLGGYFASFLPGAVIKPFPEGTAQWVPAGATFVFQMHYTTTGKEETDQTRMALYFSEPPAQEYRIEAANNTDFLIPAQAADAATSAEYIFEKPATIWALSPHMHYRGSRFRFDVKLPDGPVTTPLNVPKYDFNWQPLYLLREPIAVPAKTTVVCDGAFDNTRFNPLNPDPSKAVAFGEQSFEEMFIGYIAFSTPREDAAREPLSGDQLAAMGMGQPLTEQSLVGTKWRMGGRLVIEFKEGGKVMANGVIPGTWKMNGNNVAVNNPMQPIELGIVGDELFFNTRALRFLRTGDEPIESWERRTNPNGKPARSFLMDRFFKGKQSS